MPVNCDPLPIKYVAEILPAEPILPVAVIKPAVLMLPPVRLPLALKLVPVAAPMLGVVKLALALTMMLPEPSNAVVVLSTLALKTVPARRIPAEPLAVYV